MEKGGGSRLLQMQARFQQKQLQERELKIASLYEAQQARTLDKLRLSPATSPNSHVSPSIQPTHNVQPGKVRQMFEERRTKAGIDKSYPLQPIHNTERTKPRAHNGVPRVANTRTTLTTITTLDRKAAKTHHVSNTHTVKKNIVHKSENILNVSGDLNHNHELDLNPIKQSNQPNGDYSHVDEVDKAENNCLLQDETFPEAMAPTPTPTPRSPEPKPQVKKLIQRNPVQKRPTSPTKSRPQLTNTSTKRVTSESNMPDKSRVATQRVSSTVLKKTPSTPGSKSRSNAFMSGTSVVAGGSVGGSVGGSAGVVAGDACGVCGRRFASDRLAKHESICKKAHAKKRKPFDVLKHRLAGTEAEPFIGKLRKGAQGGGSGGGSGAGSGGGGKGAGKQLNSTWRQKHEEFIQAIRAAKQVQAHLKAGGKVSDLPPPPPSENPDYVSCPHCGRRFNQAAAERHIPKCANYQFNKPKNNKKR
ncbi:zinc finger C2HC domain-containing protein 1C [Papilio machaon]|uniref:zinc finger C2HC domain-containing protein 1C n=1 Tax=Papilio machaon TaxID=76193 RepID=UPI001E664162|nr:zinc finger C2HC domain-containing protein 1C [Papilio machaon]